MISNLDKAAFQAMDSELKVTMQDPFATAVYVT